METGYNDLQLTLATFITAHQVVDGLEPVLMSEMDPRARSVLARGIDDLRDLLGTAFECLAADIPVDHKVIDLANEWIEDISSRIQVSLDLTEHISAQEN